MTDPITEQLDPRGDTLPTRSYRQTMVALASRITERLDWIESELRLTDDANHAGMLAALRAALVLADKWSDPPDGCESDYEAGGYSAEENAADALRSAIASALDVTL